MPNSKDAPSTNPKIDATRATSLPAETPAQPITTATQEREPQNTVGPSVEDASDNAWFSQDGDDNGHAWQASEQPSVQPPVQGQPQETRVNAAVPEPIIPSKPRGVISQHSSSMSFARTSHEVSFDNDDDGEWNLSRTDTDPFKFMPPSDRTNSFPPVPLAVSSVDAHNQEPLPSNQALEVLEEAERDVDIADQEYYTGAAQGDDLPQLQTNQNVSTRQRASSRAMGGDIPGYEEQASNERYEEGLPLISKASEEQEKAPSRDFAASFDSETGNDDDFFGSTQESGADDFANGQTVQPLERKSTMQVLNSINQGTHMGHSTLGETLEEDEEDETPLAGGVAQEQHPATEDLSAKWQEAFGGDDDDDEFLVEDSTAQNKEVDPSAFFGSDDEGFLEDDDEGFLEDDHEEPAIVPQPASTSRQSSVSNPYIPQNNAPQRTTSSYFPVQPPAPVQASPTTMYSTPAPIAPYGTTPQYGAPPPVLQTDAPRTQSFADKSKGGYASPYDLPTDLITTTVKPRRKASAQQVAPTPQGPPAPRSGSFSGPPPNPLSPPGSSHGIPPQHKPPVAASHKESFFEELPMTAKPRSSSRQSIRAPSPAQPPPQMGYAPHAQSPSMPPPAQLASPMAPPPTVPAQQPAHQEPADFSNLVVPERVNPYAALPNTANHMPPPSGNTSRYSPAPAHGSGNHMVPPAAPSSRYSPAPPATKGHGSYGPAGVPGASATMLPHQPRTSSPLTHCETSAGEMPHLDRRTSSSFEPRLNRVSSLPPTREVDEEEDQASTPRSLSASHAPSHSIESRYNPASPPKLSRHTPPPPMYAGQATLSPPKRTSYAPQALTSPPAHPSAQPGFAPPPRAQTQSPSATFGHRAAVRSSDSTKRPSSAHSASPPAVMKTAPAPSAYAPMTRARGQSMNMNMIPPTDGRENDPLQRWKGVPVFTWSVGGTMVTSFPTSVPRYGMNQAVPSIIRSPGEVKVRNVKDIEPLQERLAKFPGPLKGKSKKKETIAWLTAGIETLEKDLPDIAFHAHLSLEAKRAIERMLLWKILRVFIEHDGTLEGTPAVEKAVRDILAPGTVTPTAENDGMFPSGAGFGVEATSVKPMQADGADTTTMDQIRHYLLKGDREKAVWACVDKRLWGHAMLISNTASPDLYKQVTQEFVRKEVNHPGHNNESLAALYKILSGNYEDCVDELVPVHARAGLQLISTGGASGPTRDALDGLDKWRETLCLVLNNRSSDDVKGLKALGSLLSSYGRAEAAHVCFLFARNVTIFGGLDDPNVDVVLLGSDHHQQSDQFAKETEPLLLSEVYEYGLSLAGGVAAAAGTPHLAAYKLQHAMTLAEYGYRDKALEYCDAIAYAVTSQTKRSAYHHHTLEAAVDDFMIRIKQAPKEGTNSWISKPSMGKVSDSMWNRFNKFVAGDENENGAAAADGESGPFGRVITTPTMSRSPSVSNFEVYGGSPSYPGANPQVPATAAGSRYAPPSGTSNPYDPSSQHAPTARSSMERSSSDYARNPYEPSYPSTNPDAMASNPYAPAPHHASEPNLSHHTPGFPGAPVLAPPAQITPSGGYQPYGIPESAGIHDLATPEDEAETPTQGYQPTFQGYAPPSLGYNPPEHTPEEPAHEANSGGYEAPSYQSYGYEPPSYEYEPAAEEADDAPKPKKKGIMEDDEDDIPAPKAADQSKADKDRENQEMFRKAAEEDGKLPQSRICTETNICLAKRAAAQKTAKKGWGFGGWFGGGKKEALAEAPSPGEASPGKPIRAKLGEASSFVYDPDLKRWINKKPGAENVPAKTATPPPPKAGPPGPRSVSGTPPPPMGTPPPPLTTSHSAPPPMMPPRMRAGTPELSHQSSTESLRAPTMMRSVSNGSGAGPPSAPPSRPTTSMSNASSIDDLLGAAGPRKPGQKKPRKSGRYVDVMAK